MEKGKWEMRDECAVKYNMNSKRAEEFIHHQEILDTLEYAQANRNYNPQNEAFRKNKTKRSAS